MSTALPSSPWTSTYRNKLQKEALSLALEESRRDPAFFAERFLGIALTVDQRCILRAVWRDHEVAVKSCHASGKTTVAAIAAVAWVVLHPPGMAIAIIISSDWSQVETQVFEEIHQRLARLRFLDLRGIRANKTQITLPGGNYIEGKSTNSPTGLHGYHAQHVLVVPDEFSGIEPASGEHVWLACRWRRALSLRQEPHRHVEAFG